MPSTPALDPRVSLATSVQTQPGVYALLLGSGTSTGAGIKTGWGVAEELTRRAAAASGDVPGSDFDAEAWWAEHGDGKPLGYSGLLDALTTKPSERRALLASFFEPDEEDREDGRKLPGAAHKAIADLVRRGYIRVIVTTNFDRLIEQALEAVGVFPQVVAGPAAVAGIEPLAHATCTVIKLHGDYASADQLNTLEELSTYSEAMNGLLRRVLDEYGLIVNGWSAEWDHALVAALEATAGRRYPLYWSSFSGLTAAAQRLIAEHRAPHIANVTADAFFSDLVARVDALETLAASPLSLEMNIARVKRCLPDPVRHIELRDLFDAELAKVREYLRQRPSMPTAFDGQAFQDGHDDLARVSETLLRMYATGVFLDRDRQHTDLWVWVLQQLLNARQRPDGTFNQVWDNLQHFPALLALRVAVMAATEARHDDVALRLLREPRWRDPFSGREPGPALAVLHDYRVLDHDVINAFPRWEGSRWLFPRSKFVRTVVEPILEPLLGDDETTAGASSRAEYRVALAQHLAGGDAWLRPSPGEFNLESAWDHDGLRWERDFRTTADRDAWGWSLVAAGEDNPFETRLAELAEWLSKNRRWG